MRVPPAQSGTASRHASHRHVDVAVAQVARDVGEARAEEKHVTRSRSLESACTKCRNMRV